MERVLPFMDTFDKFMMSRKKRIYGLIKWLLRKRIAKMSFKYSNSRNFPVIGVCLGAQLLAYAGGGSVEKLLDRSSGEP